MNKEKQLIKILKEICIEENIKFESFSDNWIMQLTDKENKKMQIYNYKFPNNNAAISKICDDKAALSDILEANDIPHVQHLYFEKTNMEVKGNNSILSELENLLKKHNKVVLKANFGSGGNNVYKCSTVKEIEEITDKLFKRSRSLAASPYVEIKNEYRVIVLEDKAMLVYSKQRPFVIGNGAKSIADLIDGYNCETKNIDFDYVPGKGEKVELGWKHNLAKGCIPIIIKDFKLLNILESFAIGVAKKINIKFASIDIIEDYKNNFKILEINSGVMMEAFSEMNLENYEIAKKIYREAIYSYLKKLKVE